MGQKWVCGHRIESNMGKKTHSWPTFRPTLDHCQKPTFNPHLCWLSFFSNSGAVGHAACLKPCVPKGAALHPGSLPPPQNHRPNAILKDRDYLCAKTPFGSWNGRMVNVGFADPKTAKTLTEQGETQEDPNRLHHTDVLLNWGCKAGTNSTIFMGQLRSLEL